MSAAKKKRKRHYVSTVVTPTGPPPKANDEGAEQRDGVRRGRMYKVGGRLVLVKSIHRTGTQPWSSRVKDFEGGYETGMPLATIAKAVRSRAKHPVAGCYAVGPGRVRRLKVNPRPVILYAQRPGGRVLKYLGTGKFGVKGKPRRYPSAAYAKMAAWILRETFPEVLRGYRLFWQ